MSDPVYEFKVQYVDLDNTNQLIIKKKTIMTNKALFVENCNYWRIKKTATEKTYCDLINNQTKSSQSIVLFSGFDINIGDSKELKHNSTIEILSMREIQTRYIEIDKLKKMPN